MWKFIQTRYNSRRTSHLDNSRTSSTSSLIRGAIPARVSSNHLCISCMENRNKETNERKKKKAPKYEHRGQVVFTYLYFSHARIRAARICLINTFPACLSRGYSNFVRAGRGGNNVEISLRCSNIEKSFPFLLSPPLARIFQPITRDQKHKLQGGRNKPPLRTDFYLPTSPTERD